MPPPSTPNRQDTFSAVGGIAITPADSDIAFAGPLFPRGISIGIVGTLHITTMDGSELTFAASELATGLIHPIAVRRVWSTGTTATGIKVYW
jgi:hypothetical protein